jgi:hypothetical protein
MFVEVSVKTNVVPGKLAFRRRDPLVGFTVKFAVGAKQAGVGDGVGAGVGVGTVEPVGVGVGTGVGVGVGVGVGEGEGIEAIPPIGAVAIWADASAARRTFWPPVKAPMSGVISANLPSTRTVTLLPSAGEQSGEQLRLTPAVLTVTNEPLASLTARHITRLVALSHGAPETNDPGLTEASIAPSRAALESVMFE